MKAHIQKLFTVLLLGLLFAGLFTSLNVWQIKPAQATTLAYEDFETWNANGWTNSTFNGLVEIVNSTSEAYAGTYFGNFSTIGTTAYDSSRISLSLGTYTTLYCLFHVKLCSYIPNVNGDFENIIRFRNTFGDDEILNLQVAHNGTNVYYGLSGLNITATLSNSISVLDTWTTLKLAAQTTASSHWYRLYVNEVLVLDLTPSITADVSINNIYLGITGSDDNVATARSVYFDNIQIADSYIPETSLSNYIGLNSLGSTDGYGYYDYTYFFGEYAIANASSVNFTQIMLYTTVSGNAKVAIYDSISNAPVNLLMESSGQSCTADIWNIFNINDTTAWTFGNRYWLAAKISANNMFRVNTNKAARFQASTYGTSFPIIAGTSTGIAAEASMLANFTWSSAPSYDTISYNNTNAGELTEFNVHLKDDSALDTSTFHFDNGTGYFDTNASISISGISDWHSETYKICTVLYSVIRFYWAFNDTDNNIASTPITSVTLLGALNWNWNSVWVSSTIAGTSSTFSVQFYSPTGKTISHGAFVSNNTGSFTTTYQDLGNDATFEWVNQTITLNASYSAIIWYMCANDSDGKWGQTYNFTIHSWTVEPWDTTSGNQIYRNGTAYIPHGYFLEHSSDSPTFVLLKEGESSDDVGWASWSQQWVMMNAKAWALENVSIVSVYPCMENWVLDNGKTDSALYPIANETGRNIFNQFASWIADYGIAVSYRFYMLTYAEGRVSMPYPPYHDGSLVASSTDFINKYLDFAVNMSAHPNVWFHPFDEPASDQSNWFATIANLTMQMRGAGIHHIFQIQWGYCGDVKSYGDIWATNTTNLNFHTNIVFSPHLYRYHGSFGTTGGGDPQAAYTYDGIYYILHDALSGLQAYGYHYLKSSLLFPIMVGAVGAYHMSNATQWNYEQQAYNNTLAVLTTMGIGYCAYTWQRITTFRLVDSGNTHSLRYPDVIGIYAMQYFNNKPWVFSVGTQTVSGISGYYIYGNNTSWSSGWNGTHISVSYSGNSEARFFWNVSNQNYPINSSLLVWASNGTTYIASSYFEATTNLIRIYGNFAYIGYNTTGGGSPSTPASLSVTLNSPSDGSTSTVASVTFTYTPVSVGDSISKSELWLNLSGTWQVADTDLSVTNNTVNSYVYSLPAEGTYIWNIQLYNSTDSVFANTNWTIHYYTIMMSLTISLNSPSDGSTSTDSTIQFTYTPISIGSSIVNASLWLNVSGVWQQADYTITVTNNSANVFTYHLSAYATYQWTVRVYNSTNYVEASTWKVKFYPYVSVSVTVHLDWFMRSDTFTTNNSTGYGLSSTQTSNVTSISVTATGEYTVYYGYMIYRVNTRGASYLLTSSQVAVTYWAIDGEGYQNVTYSFPMLPLSFGQDALKLELYIKFGASGTWQNYANFLTEKLDKKQMNAGTWAFCTYTKRAYNVGLNQTTASVYWGDTTTHQTGITGVEFTDFTEPERQLWELMQGNVVGFFVLPYVVLIGNLFYTIVLFVFLGMLYIRYRSVMPIVVLFVIFGGTGGIFNLLLGSVVVGIAWVVLIFAIAGIYYKVVR